MSYKILSFGNFKFGHKLAAFDYDWTLVKPKSNGSFPKNKDDWMWLRPNVPIVLRQMHSEGYAVIVITNQTKEWKLDQIVDVMNELDLPVLVGVGLNKEYQKPNDKLFKLIIEDNQWDAEHSFYVGDALGRVNDWSDSDKVFAENVGINYKSPEDTFPIEKNSETGIQIDTRDIQEVVIMVGHPGSGKSTISNSVFGSSDRYKVLHGDDLKTSSKIIKEGKKYLQAGLSIVVDATNPSIEKRKEYIDLAKSFGIKARCVHVCTSFDESLQRNNNREKVVPKIVYYTYRKKFVEPSVDEGCEVETTR